MQLDFGLLKPNAGANPMPAKAAGKPNAGVPTDLEDFKEEAVKASAVATPEKEQHYFSYAAALEGLPFDSVVRYRVRIGDRLVREGSFKTRASAAKPIRFVAVGDLANGKPHQNGIAWQIAQQQPDFMIALGDIVYPHGRVNEYMHHFWTTYNDVAQPGPKTGAPLFASIPLYPVPEITTPIRSSPITPTLGARIISSTSRKTAPVSAPGVCRSAGTKRRQTISARKSARRILR